MVHATCAALHCLSSSHTDKDLKFHQFPHDSERRKIWITACKRSDVIDKDWDFFKHKYLCSKHFQKCMYSKKDRLKKSAIPSLHLSEKPLQHDFSTQTAESIQYDIKHDNIKEEIITHTKSKESVSLEQDIGIKIEYDNDADENSDSGAFKEDVEIKMEIVENEILPLMKPTQSLQSVNLEITKDGGTLSTQAKNLLQDTDQGLTAPIVNRTSTYPINTTTMPILKREMEESIETDRVIVLSQNAVGSAGSINPEECRCKRNNYLDMTHPQFYKACSKCLSANIAITVRRRMDLDDVAKAESSARMRQHETRAPESVELNATGYGEVVAPNVVIASIETAADSADTDLDAVDRVEASAAVSATNCAQSETRLPCIRGSRRGRGVRVRGARGGNRPAVVMEEVVVTASDRGGPSRRGRRRGGRTNLRNERPGPRIIDELVTRDMSEMPEDQGLKTALHRKRIHMWQPTNLAPTPPPSPSAGPPSSPSPASFPVPSPATGQPIVEDAVDVSSASFAVAGPSKPTTSIYDVVDVSAVAGPSRPMTSMAEEKIKYKKKRALDKKNMARLPVEQRTRLQELRDRKEVGLFLMPDAPPSKKRRKVSPVRVLCPLIPGTPEVPPPRILQPWELNKLALNSSGPSRFELVEEDAATPPPPMENQLVPTPSAGVITLDEGQEVDENLLVDANIELVWISPSTSFSAERPTLQNFSPEPSTSSTRPGLSIYEEDLEEEILQWERSAGPNPGSDVEDEDCLDDICRNRQAGEFAMEDLSSELRNVLGSIDRQDDCALRESSQEHLLKFDWSHDPQVFTGVREKFTGPAGPTFPIEGMSPFQIFSKIWDEDIINLIVDETNKYAANLLSSSLSKFSRLRKWTPITPQELWTFFSIVMLQSIVPIPVEKEYWSPCLPYLKVGKFGDIMLFHRFVLIKRCLHFVDNILCARGIPTKLMKIQPIIDHLNTKFSSLYLPEQEIALDESLLLWKGRLSFSQLIATKAAQVGIKSYEICESKTGYLWQMIIYTGKKERHNVEADENEVEPESMTSRVVLKLVRPLLNRGHTLVMDNFYNSPLLSRTLKAQKTDVMGTLNLNREFVPDSLRHKNKANMRSGEVAFSQTRDLTISVWKDANVVSLISTYHRVEVGGKEKYGYYRYKPKVVLDYNLSMGGVDKKDQLLQAFPIERVRNQIWYKKLFRRLLNVSIHNSFVMFSKTGTSKITQRPFRVLLADEIIQRFRPPKIEKPLPVNSHFPAKTNVRKSRCKWCALKKVDACTAFKCESCNVNLCIIGCFRDYHISRGLVK